MLLIILLRLLIIFRKIDIVFDTTILLAKFGVHAKALRAQRGVFSPHNNLALLCGFA